MALLVVVGLGLAVMGIETVVVVGYLWLGERLAARKSRND
jgi:hypothetical protein